MNYTLILSVLLGIVAIHIILDNFKFSKRIENYGDTILEDKPYSDTEAEFERRTFQNVLQTANTDRQEQSVLDAANMDSFEGYSSEMDELLKSLSPRTNVQREGTVPANYDPTTTDDANFHSNVMDIPSFYKENKLPNYDGQYISHQSQFGSGNEKSKQQLNNEMIDQVSKQPAYMYEANGSKAFKPDTWEYKNELPMNGGRMENGVVGFDMMDGGGGFAVYDQSNVVQSIPSNETDLREGMGIPQKYANQFR